MLQIKDTAVFSDLRASKYPDPGLFVHHEEVWLKHSHATLAAPRPVGCLAQEVL